MIPTIFASTWVEAVVLGGLSRNQAAAHFKVSIASAVRWVKRFQTTGEISPAAVWQAGGVAFIDRAALSEISPSCDRRDRSRTQGGERLVRPFFNRNRHRCPRT